MRIGRGDQRRIVQEVNRLALGALKKQRRHGQRGRERRIVYAMIHQIAVDQVHLVQLDVGLVRNDDGLFFVRALDLNVIVVQEERAA